jgi:aspartate/methionine/tyrosine aminotransferase
MCLAAHVNDVAPFKVMEILARARMHERSGMDVIHMEIGEPDFPTPPLVVAAAEEHLRQGSMGYTAAGGLPELREALARYYHDHRGVAVDPRRIFLTPGASGALSLVLGLLTNPGDEVLIADPGYPCYPNFIRMAGGVPLRIAVSGESDYNLSASLIGSNWSERTRGVVLASPSNPTGTVLSSAALKGISAAIEERRGFLVSDEIYHGLEYDGRAQSVLSLSDDAFVINSFSKYFGMTGWRLGWAVVPEWAVGAAERLCQNLFICAPVLSQHAAVAAFTPENLHELEVRRRAFQARRDVLREGLSHLGFGLEARSEGAFYVYADSSRFGKDSEILSREILDRAGVALTPGTDFGVHAARQHLRFCYTASIPRIEEALQRLRLFFG